MDENVKFAIYLATWFAIAYIGFYILRKLCSRKKIIRKVIKKVEKIENTVTTTTTENQEKKD